MKAVDKIFKKVDKDHDNILNLREVIGLLNMGLKANGRPANATFHDAEEYIKACDTDKDEEISKKELFIHLKKIMNRYT